MATEEQLAEVQFNADGLVPVITQDAASGDVLMFAWMSPETLRMTLAEGADGLLEPQPSGGVAQG